MRIEDITHDKVTELLLYNKETGEFSWRERAIAHFPDERAWKIWNSKNCGKIAGSTTGNGYLLIRLFRVQIYSHRLAWFYVNGQWPKGEIDHINQVRSDNRISNLRDVTVRENARNRARRDSNLSGINGVSWSKRPRKWWVFISTVHVGYFSDFFEACCARKSAEIFHGYHENHGR